MTNKPTTSKKRFIIASVLATLAMFDAYYFLNNEEENLETTIAKATDSSTETQTTKNITKTLTEEITLLSEVPDSNYVWRLYDLYRPEGSVLAEKPETLLTSTNQTIKWTQSNRPSALVQVSNTSDFTDYNEYTSNNASLLLTTANVGENFWRVSLDSGKTWSDHKKFNVSHSFLPDAKVMLEEPVRTVSLRKPLIVTEIGLQSSEDTIGYVAQVSDSIEFHPNSLIFWLPKNNPQINISNLGTFYYRFRSVNTNQELSEWSDVQVFNVLKKTRKRKASLASTPASLPVEINVDNVANFTPPPTPVEHTTVKRDIAATTPGEPVSVSNPLSSESSVTTRLESKKTKPFNYSYNKSEISAQSFLLNSQSSQQYYQNQSKSLATGLGIHALAWQDNIGYEGSFKSGAFNVSASEPQTSVRDIEGRIHLRTFTSLPFWARTEIQTSVFVGYEVYRNIGDLYSNQFDLLKFGARFHVPFYENWSGGGEFALGYGLETSTKLEFSGHVNYYIARKWSVGLGYRLNYFTAGSAAAAPDGYLPYREGSSESFSILNYYY